MSEERHALYIIGEPGVGKSTLVEHLTRDLPYEEAERPFHHRFYDAGVMELGKRREDFSGTDALAMNVQPTVEQWVSDIRPRLLLAEGDRLANDRFFRALKAMGYTLWLYAIHGPETAEARRAQRGSDQNVVWLRGRLSKVKNLIGRWDPTILDADAPVEAWEDEMDDPVSEALLTARIDALVESESAVLT
jgi:GTPase SAR1 family protein